MSNRPSVDDVVVKTEAQACFICGDLNQTGLRLDIHHGLGGYCWVELEIPERFQGWEGVVHGGIISALLDETMGWAALDQDLWAVTARLTVDFKRPVRVGQRVRVEGRLVEAKRRVVSTVGRMTDIQTGMELATAEAKLVDVEDSMKVRLKERYGDMFARLQAARQAAREAATTLQRSSAQ